MRLEWVALVLVAVVGAALWARAASSAIDGQSRRVGLVVAAALVLTLGGAAAWGTRLGQAGRAREAFLIGLPRGGRAGGYVSSDACRACHPSQYATWHRTFHRTMTQAASPAAVIGRFDGARFPIKGGDVALQRRGDEFWMSTVERATGTARDYRIDLVTGSHNMQVYWVGSDDGNRQQMVPYLFLIEDQRWVPVRDTFLVDPKLPWASEDWNRTCIQCHATAGQPRPVAPPTEGHPTRLDTRVAELGIACESCHGPADAHVAANHNPFRRYQKHFAHAADPDIVNPRRLPSRASSEVCGQCHGITAIMDEKAWLQDGFAYRPGDRLERTRPHLIPGHAWGAPHLERVIAGEPDFLLNRFWSDGTVRVSGREWTGMVRSPCYQRGELSCLSCHSMHDSDPDDQLGHGKGGNDACLQCHHDMRERLSAHTHHAADSSGSQCYNCHMPHTTYGVLKAIRSHRIESPSVASSLHTGRPNGCNLCHLDRSLGWTADHLGRWYGVTPPPLSPEEQRVSAVVLWLLRGDAGQRALAAWSMGWDPARRASGDEWLDPFLLYSLGDPYAAVRYVAHRSLRKSAVFGDMAYDFVAPEEQMAAAVDRALEKVKAGQARRPLPREKADRVIMRADGSLQTAEVREIASRRDNRPLYLKE